MASSTSSEQRRWAVLGSNAFAGADFIDLLLGSGVERLLASSRSPQRGPLFLPYLRHGRGWVEFLQADLNHELERLRTALERFRPTHVVNFAAQSEVAPSWDHPDQWYQTNVVALARLTQALSRLEPRPRFVHISSPEIYGSCSGLVREDAPPNPSTPYAASRAAGDLHLSTLIRRGLLDVVILRPTNYYGAHQQLHKIIPRTVIRLRLGQRVQLHGGGRAVKSYIHIRDVSRGVLAAAVHGRSGAIYHLAPGHGVAVREVVRRICALAGRSFEDSVEVVAERPGQDAAYVIDATPAREELGWAPKVELDDGLRGVVDWVHGNWEAIEKEAHEYRHRP